MHLNVCLFSLMIFKIMLMIWMLVLIKVYFSLLYVEWRKWIPKNVIECWLKCKNRNWIWFTRKCSLFGANECIFALLVAFSRKWMRIFSWWTAKGVMSKYYNKHNRLASACPLRNLSPVFGRSIKRKIGIREAIT